MLEELAEQVTGVIGSAVYYIEGGDGPEFKLLVPGVHPATMLGSSESEAEKALRKMLRNRNKP